MSGADVRTSQRASGQAGGGLAGGKRLGGHAGGKRVSALLGGTLAESGTAEDAASGRGRWPGKWTSR
ncbi:hypothetical protein AB0P21_29125 [Kribbella sp. NPDC056861]|uniref:hypothetical protein n=1 Tax=Kribbella sp. NPDC056861 TaxID=3154857 RepID=UPI003445FAB2